MSNQSEKNALRASYKQARKDLAIDNPEICAQIDYKICENLLSSDAYKSAKTIFTYVSVGDETGTLGLIEQAYTDGKTVCVPRTSGRGENVHMDAVPLAKSEYLAMMESPDGAFGIPEPRGDLPAFAPQELDLIIVPSLAIDNRGIRLGYGGGYYDRYLEKIRGSNIAIIAIQRSCFVTETDLPRENHDQVIDTILTENGFIISSSISN